MVRWIQVGHEDLLHRSEGKSGVSNSPLRFLRKRVNQGDSLVIILDSRRTRLARRQLQSQSILPPTASEFTPRLLTIEIQRRNACAHAEKTTKILSRAGENHGDAGGAEEVKRLHAGTESESSTFGTVHCALGRLALGRALSSTRPLHCALRLPSPLFTDTGRKRRLILRAALSKPRPLHRALRLSGTFFSNSCWFRRHSFLGRNSGSLERALGLPSSSLTDTSRFRRETLRGHAASAWPARTRTSGSCLSKRIIRSNQACAGDQKRTE